MRMQVLHFLMPDAARVDDDTKAVRAAVFGSQLVGDSENPAKNRGIRFCHRRQRSNVAPRNNQKVYRTRWIDIVECKDIIVFVHLSLIHI